MADPKFALEDPAESVYDTLAKTRQSVIDMGRTMAELTIPSVFPPEGYQTGDDIPGNNQSIAAACVNTLASRLMFMAFPPGRPMVKFEAVEHLLRPEIEKDPTLWSKIELGLARKEIEHRKRIETTTMRSAYNGGNKALLVAGNILWKHVDIDHPSFRLPDCYVVKRNNEGRPLLTILKEKVAVVDLDEDIRDLCYDLDEGLQKTPLWEQEVEIYSVCKLHASGPRHTWLYWQEHKGEVIDGTEVETKFEVPPLYPAWLIPVYGQDWGRSYCEEYRGDLYTVENHSAALNDGASIAALMLLFVAPGSRTSVKQVKEAENLAVLQGKADDVTTLKTEKAADFNFVSNNLEAAIRRLGRAFLMKSSVQRQAERVTAEEWKLMAQELDEAMGGLYSELSQSFQRHVVLRFIALHEEADKRLPPLPEGVIRASIATGLDAMGRSSETEALTQFVGTAGQQLTPEVVAQRINPDDYLRRLAAGFGVQPEGLIKDEETVQQEAAGQMQQMQQANLLDKTAGPVAGAVAKGMADNFQQQQQQDQPQE